MTSSAEISIVARVNRCSVETESDFSSIKKKKLEARDKRTRACSIELSSMIFSNKNRLIMREITDDCLICLFDVIEFDDE